MLGAASTGFTALDAGILIFGVIGFMGVAYAYFRTNLSKSTITLLQENNEALEKKSLRLESESRALQHELEVQDQRIKKVETENQLLKERVDAKVILAQVVENQTVMLKILERLHDTRS